SWRGVEGYIEILPEYSDGLLHLEGFSHIIVIAYMHKVSEVEKRVLRVRHRRLTRLGIRIDDLPEVGVFATDSPHRPNPIAITIVKLLSIEGRRLRVTGLDLYNETPVLDIKPYDHSRVVKDFTVPWWTRIIMERVKERFGEESLL
ncbi:MAG: tRNA (N6-threonylcarbamoyladenosine(37)-N6)-methyltransferase TrmO, partial [Desulfurococcaceae archaeon]|nr:tRNA (N6-threonylcarbamoyladenosine(37)-N6)-methyltransferase TrmO [Desulfurococcaceae archaeon]